MAIPVSQAAGLGALQGLTEFLPVSSSGHLALAEILFDLEEAGLSVNVLLHAGTLLATLLVLRREVQVTARDGVKALLRPSRFVATEGGRNALVILLASLPTAAIGLLLRSRVEAWTHSPIVVGLGFLLTTLLLLSTRWIPKGERDVPTWSGALLVGVLQGLAVLPGVSRSGTTIVGLLGLGVKPERSFALSMLMSIPAVLGAVLVEAKNMSELSQGLVPAFFGAAVAFVVGALALMLLRRVVIRGHLSVFALWVFPLAIATLALAKAWPIGG